MSNPEAPDNHYMGELIDLEVSYAEIRDTAKNKGFQVLEDGREGVDSMIVVVGQGRILPVWVEIDLGGKRVARTYSNRLQLFTEKLLQDN